MFGILKTVVGVAIIAVVVPNLAPRFLAGLNPKLAADAPVVNAAAPAETGDGREIALRADEFGHVVVNTVINGLSFQMMIDTGATYVALTQASARRLGIAPPRSAYTLRMSTANGEAVAAPVVIDEIRLGGIRVQHVQAIVTPDGSLGIDLLGMSYLKRLSKFELGGGQLVLVQ